MKYYPIRISCGDVSKTERFVCRSEAEARIVARNLQIDWSGDEGGLDAVKVEVLEGITREAAIEAGYEVIPIESKLLIPETEQPAFDFPYYRVTEDGPVTEHVYTRDNEAIRYLRTEISHDPETRLIAKVIV